MKILLIDDHALFREGLAMLLTPMLAALEILEAGSCEAALALLEPLAAQAAQAGAAGAASAEGLPQPVVDLVIMDLGLPGMSGMEGLAWLQARHPQVPVVVMSSADDQDTVLRALDAGAMGFIPKSSASAVLRGALELVLAGGIYLPPSVFLPQRGGTVPPPAVKPVAEASPSDPPTCTPESLGMTHRQAEVLDLILQGHPAKSICRALELAPGTVKAHTTAVLRALKVTNRTQAVVAASRLGWRLKR